MALGRGLEALIPTSSGKVSSRAISSVQKDLQAKGERVIEVPLEKIESNPSQPRKTFSHADLEELINSIRVHGIIQPLILTPLGKNHYQVIAGERRLRAAKILGLETVPAIIRETTQQEKIEIALLENIQRKDLNPIEKAEAFLRLSEEFNLTQEEIAKRLGKSRSSVANTLRLLSLPKEVQDAIREEKISEGHGKILAGIEDEKKQRMYLKRILGLDLSVRETRKMIKSKRSRTVPNPVMASRVQEISELWGIKVRLQKQKRGGKLIFEVYSDEELENLLEKLKNIL